MPKFDYQSFRHIPLPAEEDIVAGWDGEIEQPLISIVCLAFNHQDYIEDALRGFLIQKTSFSYEIIIHDDASTDKTAEIILRYCMLYPKLIRPIFQKDNQYSQGKRISPILLSMARSSYIAYCEGDDYWTDCNKIQKQVEFLEKNKDYSLAYHDAFVFNEKGVVSKCQLPGKYREDSSSLSLKRARPISTLTACFRNIDSFRYFPRELMSAPIGDLTLWSLLGEAGKGKFMNDISPSAYRAHDGGVFSKKDKKTKSIMMIRTYAALADYYKNKDQGLYNYFIGQVFKISADSSSSALRIIGLCAVFITKKALSIFMIKYR